MDFTSGAHTDVTHLRPRGESRLPLSFEPLSPLSFLDRAAHVHSRRTAVIDGDRRFGYAELHDRCRRLAHVKLHVDILSAASFPNSGTRAWDPGQVSEAENSALAASRMPIPTSG
jgi:hypothetical protein